MRLAAALVVLLLSGTAASACPRDEDAAPVPGSRPGPAPGDVVAPAGDVDGDGVDDLLVGLPADGTGGAGAGAARILSGADGRTLHEWSGSAGEQFGHSVAGIGDVNGDGRPDLAVGAPLAVVPCRDALIPAGRVCIFDGATGRQLRTLTGSQAFARFGHALARAGDVDGDDASELIVGIPRHGPLLQGGVELRSCTTGATLWAASGAQDLAAMGAAVGGAGDVNHDGVPDVVVGLPDYDALAPGSDHGRIEARSGVDGAVLGAKDGAVAGARLGAGVSGAADIDGWLDAIAAARQGDGTQDRLLARSGPAGAPPHAWSTSAAYSDHWGLAVAGLGDVDRDHRDGAAVSSAAVVRRDEGAASVASLRMSLRP